MAASIPLTENLSYPIYRLFVAGVCLLLALALYLLISRTRLGMKIRTGAFNHDMTEALGVNIQLIHAVVFALGVALAAFPFVGSDFFVQMVTRMMILAILAILAISLDLLHGVTGPVSLGHAACFGLAGYVLALLTPEAQAVNLWWSLPLAVAASGAAALVVGFFVVRTRSIYFIMVTMAFALLVLYLFFDNKVQGGRMGPTSTSSPTHAPLT